jgi:hypothetical protein
MAVPAAVLAAAQNQLSGAGSTLRLAAVTVPEAPGAGELTGTMTVGADGSKATDPPGFGGAYFTVSSGPCVAYGSCVGRPGGYLPSEACEIAVVIGGALGACGVFDTDGCSSAEHYCDVVTLPDGSSHYGSDCPVGVVLAAGGSVGWASDAERQGNWNGRNNGCGAKGLCGLPYSD